MHIEDGSLLGECLDLSFRFFHKGLHICFGGDTILIEKLKLRSELLKPHDLLPHLTGNPRRVLPRFDFSENVEVVVVQCQKFGVFRVLLVGLVRLPVGNCEIFAHENSIQIAVDGRTDSVLRILLIFSLRVHKMVLSSELEAQAATVLDLIPLPLHESEEVSNGVGVLDGCFQVSLQHGTIGGLTFTLAQPFDVAHGFLPIPLDDDGEAMFSAEAI